LPDRRFLEAQGQHRTVAQRGDDVIEVRHGSSSSSVVTTVEFGIERVQNHQHLVESQRFNIEAEFGEEVRQAQGSPTSVIIEYALCSDTCFFLGHSYLLFLQVREFAIVKGAHFAFYATLTATAFSSI